MSFSKRHGCVVLRGLYEVDLSIFLGMWRIGLKFA